IAAIAERVIRIRWALRVPAIGMIAMLKIKAPRIAPSVLAAYVSPARRPGSSPWTEAAAIARGKLAPHMRVAGSTAQKHRTRSIWKLNHGLVESIGFTGQYGIESESMNAVHPTPAAARNWHRPRATRGRMEDRAISDPALLPIPNPTRNTARITEKV